MYTVKILILICWFIFFQCLFQANLHLCARIQVLDSIFITGFLNSFELTAFSHMWHIIFYIPSHNYFVKKLREEFDYMLQPMVKIWLF
jgi:hypothetical protein